MHMKKGLMIALNSNKISLHYDDYIICPVYKAGDVQIGVTGRAKEGESSRKAIARELGEEVGIMPVSDKLFELIFAKREEKTLITVAALPLTKAIPVLDHLHGRKLDGNVNDDQNKKVGCYVYGTAEEALEFLMKDKLYYYDSDDGIVGIAAINVGNVVELY